MYEAGENDEMSIIAIAFYTNEPNYMGGIVEIFVFDHTYDIVFVRSMVNEGFMMKMTKF